MDCGVAAPSPPSSSPSVASRSSKANAATSEPGDPYAGRFQAIDDRRPLVRMPPEGRLCVGEGRRNIRRGHGGRLWRRSSAAWPAARVVNLR